MCIDAISRVRERGWGFSSFSHPETGLAPPSRESGKGSAGRSREELRKTVSRHPSGQFSHKVGGEVDFAEGKRDEPRNVLAGGSSQLAGRRAQRVPVENRSLTPLPNPFVPRTRSSDCPEIGVERVATSFPCGEPAPESLSDGFDLPIVGPMQVISHDTSRPQLYNGTVLP